MLNTVQHENLTRTTQARPITQATRGGTPAATKRRESTAAARALGERIRALRQRLKLTLRETATVAGISKPFLSQVERGLASPSLTSLEGIASALGVTKQYFAHTPLEESKVHRGDELQFSRFTDSANFFAQLTCPSVGRKLEAMLIRMPKGETRAETRTRADEEILCVMEGEVLLELGHRSVRLRVGDSCHYQSAPRHRWINDGDKDAVVIWVGTPELL